MDDPKLKNRSISIKTGRKLDTNRDERDKREDIEEPVSPAGRLFHQPEFNCHIIAVMGSGKSIDIDVVKSGLMVTLVRHPRFSSIVVKEARKKPRWVPSTVNIDDHVIIPKIDPPTSTTLADKVVEDYIASLSATPMDRSRPLWELHLLNFPTSSSAATGVFRLHHSLGDGISLVSLLLACTRKTSDPNSLPSLPQPQKPRAKNLNFKFFDLFVWLLALLLLAWNTVVDVLVFIATSLFLRDFENPLKGSKGVQQRPKRFIHRTLSLDDVKAIKAALNCTVNDVLIGVTSAGISAYISRKYGEKEGHKKLPRNMRVRGTVLVNIRPSPGLHALAEMMEGKNKGAKWGNQIGYLIIPFTVMKFKDPLEYVRRGKAIADRKKNSLEAVFTYWSGVLIVKILGIKAAAYLCSRMLSNTTLSFSNILGPMEEIEFYGHPLVYLAPSVYGHPQALTLHYQSYLNKVTISIAVDEVTIPDPHRLLDDFAESLKLMKEAVSIAKS